MSATHRRGTHEVVSRRLVTRMLAADASSAREKTCTKRGMRHLRHDISSMRYELSHILQGSRLQEPRQNQATSEQGQEKQEGGQTQEQSRETEEPQVEQELIKLGNPSDLQCSIHAWV